MKGYVFSGIMKEDRVKQLLENYFVESDVFFMVYDTVRYDVGKGVPSELRDEGRAFSETGEIRWKKKADDGYFVSILSEYEMGVPEELAKTTLELEVKRGNAVLLIDPKKARHASPSFDSYPGNAKKLKVSHYMHSDITILTRLRGFG